MFKIIIYILYLKNTLTYIMLVIYGIYKYNTILFR